MLVSDVFGVTPALLKISEKLGGCSIVDPYQGQMMAFENEAQAYACFIESVGLDNYLANLLKTVVEIEPQATLIGFSVGAAVIWRLSEMKYNNRIKQAYCFYGSQIRNFTAIEPCFKINVILPKSEDHFDVVALQDNLSRKANVKTTRVEYLHGFMNYHSINYNEVAYMQQLDSLCLALSE